MIRAFLLGGRGGGGEEVFVRDLAANPPPGISYALVLDHHESVPGARAATLREVLLNRLVHPFLWPLPGFRAYRIGPEIDVVHLHNFPAWIDASHDVPVVTSVGGSGYPHYLEAYLGWTRPRIEARYRRAHRLYRVLGVRNDVAAHERVDAVMVFSDYAAGILASLGVPEAKLRIVPPGFDIPDPGPREPSSDRFTFLLVGRQPERKGADLAVAAVRQLRARGLKVKLVLVGDAAYPGMAVEDLVQGFGPVGREELFESFYGRADAVLVPSRAEGFGFAAVEAMGHRLPVVVSRRDALPWIVAGAGLTADPGSAESLADAMAELASDRAGARERGVEGRRRFEAEFGRDVFHRRLGAVYREVAGGGA